jgi:hypothetical protein
MQLKYSFLLLIILVFISGCSNSTTQIPVSPNPTTFSYPTSLPPLTVAKVPLVANLQKFSRDGWEIHKIPDSQLNISLPKGWTIQTRNRTYDGMTYHNILVAMSPNFDILINARSYNASNGRDAIKKELDQGYIDNDFYQGLVDNLKSTNPQYSSVSKIVTDPVYYRMSGYPARKIEWEEDGAPVVEYIIIPNEYSIIITKMQDFTVTQSSKNPSDYVDDQRLMEAVESIKSVTN